VGCYPTGIDDLARSVSAALQAAGFRGGAFPNVMDYKWRKFLGNLGNALSAITDGRGDARPVLELLRAEAWAVIRAANIPVVPREAYDLDMGMIGRRNAELPFAQHGSSTWQSLYRQTGSVETRQLNGYIAELGARYGVATPANARITELAEAMARMREQPGKYTAEELLGLLRAGASSERGEAVETPVQAVASATAARPRKDGMKIAAIEVDLLNLPYPVPFTAAWRRAPETARQLTLVRVVTDAGLTGYGNGGGDEVRNVLRVRDALIGQDPLALERLAPVIRRARAWLVDMALCDIAGKAAGRPLHQLWGTYQTRLRAYASTVALATPEQRAEDALRYLEQGFTAIKLRHHAATIVEDVRLVEAVRTAVGDRMEIMVDANQASYPTFGGRMASGVPSWDYQRALHTARELQQLGAYWLEEPLPRDDFENIARLCDAVDIRIAGGEGNEGLPAFARMLRTGVYDVLQPDATSSEGLSQLRKIAAMAELMGREFCPHHGNCGIGLAAHLQLCATLRNCPFVEFILDPPWRTVETYQQLWGIVTDPITIDDEGFVPVPMKPGLGVEVDEAAIARYRVA